MPRADSSAHSIRVFVAVIGAAATIIAALIAANAKAPRQAEAPPLPSRDNRTATDWANLGAAAILAGRPSEAMAAYDKALQLDPDNWLAHYNLGCYYARAGKRDDALSHVAAALRSVRIRGNVDMGSVLKAIRTDSALADLRDDPRLQKILAAN